MEGIKLEYQSDFLYPTNISLGIQGKWASLAKMAMALQKIHEILQKCVNLWKVVDFGLNIA